MALVGGCASSPVFTGDGFHLVPASEIPPATTLYLFNDDSPDRKPIDVFLITRFQFLGTRPELSRIATVAPQHYTKVTIPTGPIGIQVGQNPDHKAISSAGKPVYLKIYSNSVTWMVACELIHLTPCVSEGGVEISAGAAAEMMNRLAPQDAPAEGG